jgi:hypothetical protein
MDEDQEFFNLKKRNVMILTIPSWVNDDENVPWPADCGIDAQRLRRRQL